ncbi:hypothetical protein ACFQ9Y_19320, partial [Peribacillus simplex]|uniref:hypothetical protein n=1 Tax=Peribacillus simplex TaxID=1478 RepID=UPI003673247C
CNEYFLFGRKISHKKHPVNVSLVSNIYGAVQVCLQFFYLKSSVDFRKSAPFPPTVCQASSAEAPVVSRLASFSAGVSQISSIQIKITVKKPQRSEHYIRPFTNFFDLHLTILNPKPHFAANLRTPL